MFAAPLIYVVVFFLVILGVVLIAARYLMLGVAGLLLLLIPVEVLIRWLT